MGQLWCSASNLDIDGNYNKKNAEEFGRAINEHINSGGVKEIAGSYRGDPVTHYLNPTTGLNVMADPSGKFLSGWKLRTVLKKPVVKRGA